MLNDSVCLHEPRVDVEAQQRRQNERGKEEHKYNSLPKVLVALNLVERLQALADGDALAAGGRRAQRSVSRTCARAAWPRDRRRACRRSPALVPAPIHPTPQACPPCSSGERGVVCHAQQPAPFAPRLERPPHALILAALGLRSTACASVTARWGAGADLAARARTTAERECGEAGKRRFEIKRKR